MHPMRIEIARATVMKRQHTPPITRQKERRRQPGRTRADDNAIVHDRAESEVSSLKSQNFSERRYSTLLFSATAAWAALWPVFSSAGVRHELRSPKRLRSLGRCGTCFWQSGLA